MSRKNSVGLTALVRVVAGVFVCGAGLLTVVPPETTLMWRASIILAEWGHWLGLLSVFLLLRWTRSWLHGAAAVLTLVGIALLLAPLARAYASAASLTADLHSTFGIPTTISTTGAPPRPQPLAIPDLLFGVSAGEVIVDEHVYTVVDGQRLTPRSVSTGGRSREPPGGDGDSWGCLGGWQQTGVRHSQSVPGGTWLCRGQH